jgi:peptidoglycan-associated lipoprotein
MITSKSATRLALIVLTAASLAACATKAPPPPPAPVREEVPPPPPPPPPPVEAPKPTGPVPGSTQDFLIQASDRVFFDLDSYSLRADGSAVLDAQAAWLVRYPMVKIRIEGNADERGTREYNFALGARRANSVRDYLVSKGVAGGRIDTVSFGKERPISDGSNEEAWAQNRNGHTVLTAGTAQ